MPPVRDRPRPVPNWKTLQLEPSKEEVEEPGGGGAAVDRVGPRRPPGRASACVGTALRRATKHKQEDASRKAAPRNGDEQEACEGGGGAGGGGEGGRRRSPCDFVGVQLAFFCWLVSQVANLVC